ncbi:class F sortase [Streptomyces sp. NPDC090025]|uniref:class F sortase n=1 Tax=Streptomyces sp. NPDC090025 TaxID=3365922 RepID=UPI0038350888
MARRRSGTPRGTATVGRAPTSSPYERSPRRPVPHGPVRHRRGPRRSRRLRRLARTVAVTLTLVVVGVWWAQDEEPAGPALAAGPGAHGMAAALPGSGGSAAGPHAAGPDTGKGSASTSASTSASGKGGGDGGGGRVGTAKAPGATTRTPPKPQPPPAPLARSRPTALAVPAITIEAPVVGLGLDPAGALSTPPVDNPRIVGWYAHGVTPGERGTAVVVGHRDTRTGPAIFLNLNSLAPGNTVRVARADGRVAVFTVDRVRTYTKAEFPDAEVYGPSVRPELRLLTCGGTFDRKAGYASNIVVFAHLTGVDRQI